MNYIIQFVLWTILVTGILLWVWLPNEEKVQAETKEVVQYWSERETHLYNKVEKTVDLPWFWDYQDLLASYAYNTCKTKLWSTKWTYSCENLVLTWNAENWWWRRDARNTANKNGTVDWWLCQLNSKYHAKFIKSEWFNNPLAQLDYCLQVREDAQRKWSMPRYAFNVRHKRNWWIVFTQSDAWTVVAKPNENLYLKAKQQEERTQLLYVQYWESKKKELQYWKDCVTEWITCTK
jgi:hypothetical protein